MSCKLYIRCWFVMEQENLKWLIYFKNQGPLNGGVSNGGLPDLDLSFLSCPFWDFPDFCGIFPICSGMVRRFPRFVLFLSLGLLRAPTRNNPERVRDTIWTFREKVGNPPVWKPPGLASLKKSALIQRSTICSKQWHCGTVCFGRWFLCTAT